MVKNSKPQVIVILGPTGIGKSALALKIAQTFNFDLLSADAFMVYRGLNIGTNKPTKEEIAVVKHYYGLDLVDLTTNYNIYQFQQYARNIINHSTKPIVIVGGSMLYLDSVIYDYSLDANFDNSNKFDNFSNEELYQKLITLDPLCSNKIQPQNRKRVITALNYYLQFHKSITLNKNKKQPFYDCLYFYLKPADKWQLNNQNAKRIEEMQKQGWIQEVKELLEQYDYETFLNSNAAKAIGYIEIAQALHKNQPVDWTCIINRTNHFVKHQLAWYKKQESFYHVLKPTTDFAVVEQLIKGFLNHVN